MTQVGRFKPSLTMMDSEKMESIHGAALQILEDTGLNVHHAGLRERLRASGARIGEGVRVYVPANLVEDALKTARKPVVVHDRNGEAVMPMGAHQIYFGTGSDLIFTRDHVTGERRYSLLEDVSQSAKLCDALPEYDFVMSFGLPSDIPNENAEPMQYYALLRNTTKPVIMTSFSGLEAFERMHAMAVAVAGGEEAFRQRPNYIIYGQFISPLQHDHQALERLVFCAEHEVPLIYVPTIMPSASGPITLAGSLALATAESLAGLVMQQLVKPGAPFIFGACVSQMDMRTMQFPYGSPEWRLNDLLMAEMSRFYELPVFGTAAATDSKVVDAQAGLEYGTSLLVAALAGTNLIHDVGYMESGLMGSLESILLGAETVRWVRQFVRGFDVSEETLALEVIKKVGPGGQFLDQTHTLKHLRENMWSPYTLDHITHDEWAARGSKSYSQRARTKVDEILAKHEDQPLPGNLDEELRQLLQVEISH
jgi:trimethylamine--corrinoid protein Co-methyltransferase